jgi:class 3 adenylate cyclase/tetratricopeptide (TPR) repeat protein
VTVCRRCNHENPDGAAFCNACGNPLERLRVEVRKPATLIFCDVTGSTELADRIDAEAVREVLFSCFREVRDAIERHGGTVEKFIGDAVVGVFGVPVAHEDDPLRAARAALDVRAALPALNDDLERRFGARLAVRTGINTGEVVAGDPSTRASFVSGDAVNVAARLEQAAAPGQILLGETTYALVRDAVEARPLPPLDLKGKPEPVACFELVGVYEQAVRAVRAPLLGRDAELAVLGGALADATGSGAARRLLVVGEAGVGKSRLVEEFLAHADAHALGARCLPYGEGITYSPLVQLVRQAAAIGDGSGRDEALDRLRALLAPLREDGGTAAAILAQVTGLAEGVASTAEIAWAARRFVEALAAERPLVLVVDDLQWAEAPLVELLDEIAERARARVLVLCLARPELEPSAHAPVADVRLDALGAEAAGELLERLLGSRDVTADARAGLLAAAGGNPLFLEELVAFLESHGDASAIPPTLDALLSAHVDMLDVAERPVLERGSIEGEVFHHDGVVALGDEPPDEIEQTLVRLRTQDLVREAQATLGGGAASRFRHLLVRDVVYRSASKRRRAALHLRFAEWLEERLGDRVAEVAEIAAYHLEQAWRLRAELGPLDAETVAVGERAASLLGRSARRALARGDGRSALSLFTRAAELAANPATRLDFALERGIAAREAGEFSLASSILQDVSAAAAEQDAADVAARSAIERALIRHHTEAGAVDEVRSAAAAGLETFRALGDEYGEAVALAALAEERWIMLRCAEMEELLEQALVHAELARSERLIASVVVPLARAILFGPRPSSAAVARCEELLARARQIGPTVEAGISMMLAVLEAAQGRGERSAELSRRSKAILEELAPGPRVASAGQYAGLAALILGDPAAAEQELRAAYDLLAGLGERAVASTVAALLARALVDLGRPVEAEELCALSLEWADPSDTATHAYARSAWACALVARGGDGGVAVRHARDAVQLSAASDFTSQRGDAFYDLALVLEATGDVAGAAAAASQAAALYAAKENVVSGARADALAARLGGSVPG